MGIAAKHSYRFLFLKSDRWKDFRVMALVHHGEACSACKKVIYPLDIHHLWYPKRREKPWDVRPMCRECHIEIHSKTSPGKYQSLEEAVEIFHAFLDGAIEDGSGRIVTPEELENEILVARAESKRAERLVKNAAVVEKSKRRDIERNSDFLRRYVFGRLVPGKRDDNLLKWFQKRAALDPDFIKDVKEIAGVDVSPLTKEYLEALASYRSSPV